MPTILKTEFTASLLDAQHHKDSEKEKVTSSFVVSFDKTLNDIPPFYCGRQVVGLSNLPFILSQSDNKLANKSRARAREQKCANEQKTLNTPSFNSFISLWNKNLRNG